MPRSWIALLATLALIGPAAAEPIRWGYRVVNADTGAVLDERSGLTDTSLSFTAALRPELDGRPGGAGNPTFDPNPSAENRSRVTIIDEASGGRKELLVSYLVTQQWDLRGADGQREWDWIGEYTVATHIRYPGDLWRPTGGRSEYRFAAEGGSVYVEVSALSPTPEPATLALAGVGLAGVGLLRRRTRR